MKARIRYRTGYKYQFDPEDGQDFVVQTRLVGNAAQSAYIELTQSGVLRVKPGYAWDGPSGPTFDTPAFMRGSLAHDALYQLMRERKLDYGYRKAADELLYSLCREDGMWPARAAYVLWGVKRFAAYAAEPGKTRYAWAP